MNSRITRTPHTARRRHEDSGGGIRPCRNLVDLDTVYGLCSAREPGQGWVVWTRREEDSGIEVYSETWRTLCEPTHCSITTCDVQVPGRRCLSRRSINTA